MAQSQTAKKPNATTPKRDPVDKKAKFISLGTKRVNKVLQGLRHIGNLSTYEYTDEQVTKMFDTITAAVDGARARYQAGGRKKDDGFTF